MKNQVEILLHDLTYNTKYEFLDYGKHKDELDDVAGRNNIKFPAHDLAIFKGTYGFVDRQNKNGCTLPKEEVEKALGTLRAKAVDFDHLRQRVVGHWLEAKLEGDTIIAYGVFHKGNFSEDYELVKKLMDGNNLGISFEAWGNTEITGNNSYNLNDIEFAGGALLIKTQPAFDGAGVLELSNKKILEFAKIMTVPEKFIKLKKGQSKIPENTGAPNLREATKNDLLLLKQEIGKRCETCLFRDGTHCWAFDFTTELGWLCDSWVPENIQELEEMRENATHHLDKKKKKKKGEAKTMERIQELEKEVAKLKEDIVSKDTELASKVEELGASKAIVEELKKESEEAKVKIEDIEKAKVSEIEKAKKDATVVAERKSELGEEFSKDIDLLDDTAFALAQSKKEISEKDAEIAKLKDGKPETASLETGSKKGKEESKEATSRKKVSKYAFEE